MTFFLREPLTMREMDFLTRAARGLSNQEIGRELWVTEQTSKHHIGNIIRKLGVDNRTAAVWRALELGIIEPPRVRTPKVETVRCHVCRASVEVPA